MPKMRVYELARALNLENRELIDRLDSIGIKVNSVANSISEDLISQVVQSFIKAGRNVPRGLLESLTHSSPAVKSTKPGKSFHVDPENLSDFLERAREGDVLSLENGDYKGPFLIDKQLTLIGNGYDTVLYAGNELVVRVSATGVRFESLSIERTDGGAEGKEALVCDLGCEPLLKDVRLLGTAPGALFENAVWKLPPLLDLQQLKVGRSHETEIAVTVAAECRVRTSLPSLMVSPSFLAPGPAFLRVIVRGADAVPGGRISTDIILTENSGDTHAILVTAAFVASAPLFAEEDDDDSEDEDSSFDEVEWGVTFEKQAAQRFLSKFRQAEAQYGDFRDDAVQFLQEIAEFGHCLYYLRKRGQGKKPGQEKWELTIATDNLEYPLPPILAKCNCTLKLTGVVDDGGEDSNLFVLDATGVDVRRGCRDGFGLPLLIAFDSYHTSHSTLPWSTVESISQLPDCSECLPTADQLAIWESHVKIERSIAIARQFCVSYNRYNIDSHSTHISFRLNADSALLSYAENETLLVDEFWRRAKGARNDFIKLVDDGVYFEDRRDSAQNLGRIEKIDEHSSTIKICIDEDLLERLGNGYFTVPKSGCLLFDAYGNISEVKRKEQALRDLREGRAANPFLGRFFFDPCQARVPDYIPELEDYELLNPERVNDEQRKTVEKVMASPDIALVQGPPGTGKTTVIAEICYQVARRGGRTLIASQTNLAVDNAMSRLVHHPLIRALRKGKPNKVEDEGKPYLEDRVIGTWLAKTSDHCEQELNRRRDYIDLFRRLLNDEQRLKSYIILEEHHEVYQREIRKQQQCLLHELAALERKIEADSRELVAVREFQSRMEQSAAFENRWTESSAVELQEHCIPLVLQHPETIHFQQTVDKTSAGYNLMGAIVLPLSPMALLARYQSLREQSGAVRSAQLQQSAMLEQAMVQTQALRSQLDRLATIRGEHEAANRELVQRQHDAEQAESRHAELNSALQESERVWLAMKAVVPQNGQIDWSTPAAHAVQADYRNCFEQREDYNDFEIILNRVVGSLVRMGFEVPQLPVFSRAGRCRRLISAWSAQFGADILQRGLVFDSRAEINNIISRLDSLQRRLNDQTEQLTSCANTESSLSPNVVPLSKRQQIILDTRREFSQWLVSIQHAAEQIKAMPIAGKARLSGDFLPALPASVQRLVEHIGSDKVPWLASISQLKEAVSISSGRARIREPALESIKDVRFMLEEGFRIVQERHRPPGFDAARNGTVPLDKLRQQASSLLNRIRTPLGFIEKIFEWCGECGRRRMEHDQLVMLRSQVKTYLKELPSLEDDSVIFERVSALSQQGEAWFKQLVEKCAAQLAHAESELKNVQKLLQETELLRSKTADEMKLLNILAGNVCQTITARTEEFAKLGLAIPGSELNGDVNTVALLRTIDSNMSSWVNDVESILSGQADIDPDTMYLSTLRMRQVDLERQAAEVGDHRQRVAAAISARDKAHHTAVAVEAALSESLDAWEKSTSHFLKSQSTLVITRPDGSLAENISTAGRIKTACDLDQLHGALVDLKRESLDSISALDESLRQLESLNPQSIIRTILEVLAGKERDLAGTVATETEHLTSNLRPALDEIEDGIRQKESTLHDDRSWWCMTWEAIPSRLREQMASDDLHSVPFLRSIAACFTAWQHELQKENAYLERYEQLVSDWIGRLRTPSERDATDLRSIYLNNANVIGITCSQAATSCFTREFPEFDVVIIDEVSKCTPPELMIPALKGKKVVLVGDHRQLPPMFEDKTIQELAEDIGVPVDDLSFIKASMFKSLYNRADDSIKQDLRIQYRMHTSIMGAINQFYDGRLKCGIPDPEVSRAHGLAGPVLRDDHHIVWVCTPLDEENQELKDGTSAYNLKEIDIIEKLCRQMDAAWAPHVANGEKPKEVAVITFYLAQLRRIQERIRDNDFPNLKIRRGSVDRFQGMERPVVIVSMVRNNSRGDVGFAREPERVNVAFSRAQELLAIVGCRDLFVNNARHSRQIYQEVSNHIRRHGGLLDVSAFVG